MVDDVSFQAGFGKIFQAAIMALEFLFMLLMYRPLWRLFAFTVSLANTLILAVTAH